MACAFNFLIMKNEAQQILESALQLPQNARAFLAEKLIESLDAEADFEISDEWRAEIARRCEEIDNGMIELIPAEEVFKKAFEALG